MEKTFETPGGVRLYVENQVGSVAITARETTETVVSLEADTPEAESSSSGRSSSAGRREPPRGDGEDPPPPGHAFCAATR